MNTRSTSLLSKKGQVTSPKYAIVAFRESLTCAIYNIQNVDKPRKKVSGATIKVETNVCLRKGTIVSTADDFEMLLVRLQKVNISSFFGISKRKIGNHNIAADKTQTRNVSIKRSTVTQSTKRRRTDENCITCSDGPRNHPPRSTHSEILFKDVQHPHTTNHLISPEYLQLHGARSDGDKQKSSSTDLPSSSHLSKYNLDSQESSLCNFCNIPVSCFCQESAKIPTTSSASIVRTSQQSELSKIPPSPTKITTNTTSPDSSSVYILSQDDSSTSDLQIPPPSPHDIATPEGSFSGAVSSSSPLKISPSKITTNTSAPDSSSSYLLSQDDSSANDIQIPPPSPHDIPTPEGSFSGTVSSNPSESVTRDTLSQLSIFDILPDGSFSEDDILSKDNNYDSFPSSTHDVATPEWPFNAVELLSTISPSPQTVSTPISTSSYCVSPDESSSSNLQNSPPLPHDIATQEGSFCETVSPDPRKSRSRESPSPLSLSDITTPDGLFSDDISTPTDKNYDIHQQLSIIKPIKYTSQNELLRLEYPTPCTENNNEDATDPLYDLPPLLVRQLNTMIESANTHTLFTPSSATTILQGIPSKSSAVPTIPLLPHNNLTTIEHQSSASSCKSSAVPTIPLLPHNSLTTIEYQSSAVPCKARPNNVPITDPKFMKLKVFQIIGPNLDTDMIQARIDDLPEEDTADESLPYIISEYILKESLIECNRIPERFAVKILDRIFTLEELEGRNVYGTNHVTKGALDRRKVAAIDEAVKSIFPGTYHIWKICVNSINSHIRYVLQKIPQLYRKTPTLSIDGNTFMEL